MEKSIPQRRARANIQESPEPVQSKYMSFTDMFNEPYDINKQDYIGNLPLNKYIDKALEDRYEHQFPLDIVRNHGTINGGLEDINDNFSEGKDYTYYSDIFDKVIKFYVPEILNTDLTTFKRLNTQDNIMQLNVELSSYFLNYGGSLRISDITYNYTLAEDNYKLKVTCICQVILRDDPEINVGNGSFSLLYDIKENTYSGHIQLDIKEEFIIKNLFNEPYDINRHSYTGKWDFNYIIASAIKDLNVEAQFTTDIKRLHNLHVNYDPFDKSKRVHDSNGIHGFTDAKSIEDVSIKFNKFIKSYVPEIPIEYITIFKKLHTQNLQSLIHVWLIIQEPSLMITPTQTAYHYTLYKDNYKLKFTLKYVISLLETSQEIIGNGSYSMLFDITNNSYSADIQLHINPSQPVQTQPSHNQSQPDNQDECFTFVKRLFGRTGGTRKKSKVYGMPYTYRKVYRKKCYKVSNRLTKRVFAKCTTKKKALKQLRLLRYLESK